MTSEFVSMGEMETTLKDFLRVSWNQKTCPKCGAPWHKKKNQCKNKKCAITLEEGKDVWVETRYPVLIDLAKLIVLKKMKLKKAKKKLKLSKLNIPKKDLKILAAILAQVQLIDVDWKSIVPLSKIIRSGLIVGLTILLWLFLYGLITLNLINIGLTVIVGIIIPSTVGLILRARVNSKVKKAKRAVEEEKALQEGIEKPKEITGEKEEKETKKEEETKNSRKEKKDKNIKNSKEIENKQANEKGVEFKDQEKTKDSKEKDKKNKKKDKKSD